MRRLLATVAILVVMQAQQCNDPVREEQNRQIQTQATWTTYENTYHPRYFPDHGATIFIPEATHCNASGDCWREPGYWTVYP
jgi:hypothetical protein